MGNKNLLAMTFAGLLLLGCTTTRPGMVDVNNGFEHLKVGEYTQAEPFFNKALEADADNPYALLNLGVVYQNTGRVSQAKEMYRKVIALNPEETPDKVSEDKVQGKSLVEIAKENLAMLP